jgi:hypothetical protein
LPEKATYSAFWRPLMVVRGMACGGEGGRKDGREEGGREGEAAEERRVRWWGARALRVGWSTAFCAPLVVVRGMACGGEGGGRRKVGEEGRKEGGGTVKVRSGEWEEVYTVVVASEKWRAAWTAPRGGLARWG